MIYLYYNIIFNHNIILLIESLEDPYFSIYTNNCFIFNNKKYYNIIISYINTFISSLELMSHFQF